MLPVGIGTFQVMLRILDREMVLEYPDWSLTEEKWDLNPRRDVGMEVEVTTMWGHDLSHTTVAQSWKCKEVDYSEASRRNQGC